MGWIDGEVDGVAVKVRSIVGSAEFGAVFEQFMEYEAEAAADRLNMNTGFGDPFNDTSDVTLSNAYLESGGLRNTVTAAVAPADALINNFKLTGNTAQTGFVASASSSYDSNYQAWEAFNHYWASSNVGWISGSGSTQWLQLQIPAAKVPSRYVIHPSYDASEISRAPKDFKLQGSTNGSTWTDLDTRTGITSWTANTAKEFTISGVTAAYNYFRLYMTADNGYGAYEINELEIYAYTNPVVNFAMSSASQNGYVASGSSSVDGFGTYQPYKVFDKQMNGQGDYVWTAAVTTGWLRLQLPAARIVTSYAMQADGGYNDRMPNTWTLQGSNNGSTWTTLDSRSGVTWGNSDAKYFSFSNTTEYLYYQINVTSNNGGEYLTIAEWQLYYEPVVGEPNPATVTLDSYDPTATLEAVKVKLWLEDLDSSGAIACGNSGSDKLEAYLSYDGNSTFTQALNFPAEDIKPAYTGSNIYIFTSEAIDVSSESISGLGLKVQSFARSVAPNFKLHGALVVGRPVTEE